MVINKKFHFSKELFLIPWILFGGLIGFDLFCDFIVGDKLFIEINKSLIGIFLSMIIINIICYFDYPNSYMTLLESSVQRQHSFNFWDRRSKI